MSSSAQRQPNPLRWTVLGAGTAAPHASLSPSGHLLSYPCPNDPTHTRHILVDLGPGTLWRLAKTGVSWWELDAIFVTHAHLDHTLDLQALMFASNLPDHLRTTPLPIYFGPGMLPFIARLQSALGHWFTPKRYEVLWTELAHYASLNLSENLQVDALPVQHHATSLAYRFTHNTTTIAYSGDSALCPPLIDLCKNASLALVECSTTPQNPAPGHMTPEDISALLRQAKPSELALVHRYPELDAFDFDTWRAALHTTTPIHLPGDGWSWSADRHTTSQPSEDLTR